MMMLRYFFLLAVIAISGCSTNSGEKFRSSIEDSYSDPWEPSLDLQLAGAYLIKEAKISGLTISLVFACSTPDPCWAFNRSVYTRSANSYTIKAFAKRTTNDPCIQILGTIDATFGITVEEPGSYTFRFWRHDGTTLDTTLTIR